MLGAGTVFGLLFPETRRGGAVPQHQSKLMGREFFHEQRLSSSEELRGEVPLSRVNALR